MESPKDILNNMFAVAAGNEKYIITIVAKDLRQLKVWLLNDCLQIAERFKSTPGINLVFQRYDKDKMRFIFTSGSIIELLVFHHENDAKCGVRDYLVTTQDVDYYIRWQLTVRCKYMSYII